MASARGLWRQFAIDIALTIAAAILFGLLWLAFLRESGHSAPLEGLAPYAPWVKAAFGIGIGLLFMLAVRRVVRGYLRLHGDPRNESMVGLFFNLFIAFAVLLYLASVDQVSLQNLFLGSALAGVVLGLASQTLLGNVFAGITMVLWGPFRVGERVSIISASYGALAPTFPHEMLYPAYTGSVQDLGLLYTVLRLDSGQVARIPNSVVFQALVVNLSQSPDRALRVRITFPLSVRVEQVQRVLPRLTDVPGLLAPGYSDPKLFVADLGPTTWDGVVVAWVRQPDEDRVRDALLREVLAGVAAPPPAGPLPGTTPGPKS
ncbi:MAG TPA: mechanosensitive ion channel family protein [Thermoplasmata archaeon]|nr:mechanosensitive ion channel family protein [Thermoplasmata archaeon]